MEENLLRDIQMEQLTVFVIVLVWTIDERHEKVYIP